jgi:alanine-glyoxylate transaminase/serine-glyoxylate transaminase/serine-pyruvate transaminase
MGADKGLLHTTAHISGFVDFTILQFFKFVNLRIHSVTAFHFAQTFRNAKELLAILEDSMRTGINHLFIPGPTNVPEPVRMAMNVTMQDHRAHDYGAPNLGIFRDLKTLFRTTDGHIMLFPGSGTAAWEAAITNTLSPGDRVLMARHGQFSMLWAQMAERLGLNVDLIDVPWGAAAPVSEFARKLAADKAGEIKAVFITQNETATGVASDVAALRRALDDAFHDALLFLDGVSSIGCIPFEMDAWGVDLAVTGSQKGMMMPPGLGILGVSQKALKASQTATMRRAFFEFSDQLKNNETGYFPYTPPVQLLHALRAALDQMMAEGLDNVIARHRRLGAGVRAAVKAWGMDLCAESPAHYSDTVTAIRTPEGVDARDVIRIGYDRYNASFGSGLGPLAGKVFRIGHIGHCNEGMCLTAIALAELSMAAAGAKITFGSGVAAAQEVYASHTADAARIAAE